MNNILKIIIEVFTALLTPTIAILGVYIAVQQYRLAKEKHRIEIYDRRMKIYKSTMELLRNVVNNLTIDEEAFFDFERGISEAEFLFGKEVIALLEDISSLSYDVLLAKSEEGYQEIPIQLTPGNNKHFEAVDKLLNFEHIARDIFTPYLRLPILPVKHTRNYISRYKDSYLSDNSGKDEDIDF